MNDYSKIQYKYEKYLSEIHLITDNNEIDNVQIGFFLRTCRVKFYIINNKMKFHSEKTMQK